MQVNVFISRTDGALRNELLVLPTAPTAPVPTYVQAGWTYFATTESDDPMFGSAKVAEDINSQGFSVAFAKVRRR